MCFCALIFAIDQIGGGPTLKEIFDENFARFLLRTLNSPSFSIFNGISSLMLNFVLETLSYAASSRDSQTSSVIAPLPKWTKAIPSLICLPL